MVKSRQPYVENLEELDPTKTEPGVNGHDVRELRLPSKRYPTVGALYDACSDSGCILDNAALLAKLSQVDFEKVKTKFKKKFTDLPKLVLNKEVKKHRQSEPDKPKVDIIAAFDKSDDGNAEYMKKLYGDELIFCPAFGWLQYTGTHWQMVSNAIAFQLATIALKKRCHEMLELGDMDRVKASMPDKKRIADCVTLYQHKVTIEEPSVFDSDPDLLNCQNGVVNLRTGSIEKHKPCQHFTYCVPVEYRTDADMSVWNNFIHEAVGGKEEVAHYLQKAVGYSLTGRTREEKLFYVLGPTGAGKGTFAEEILTLLPKPLSKGVNFNTFTAQRDVNSQNFDLAPLKPARVIIASESNRHQSLNPAKIKQLTGGDEVNCAFKHRDFFSYRPQFKVWLVSNHPVNADADDDALWARVQVIEFPVSHRGKPDEDTGLKERLKSKENLEGALRWMVEGATEWYKEGLKSPEDVRLATQSQRDEQDYVKHWLDDCCELGNEHDFTTSAALTASYNEWCRGNNVKPERTNDLAGSLVKRFHCIPARKNHGKVRGYKGIAIIDEFSSVTEGDTGDRVTAKSQEVAPHADIGRKSDLAVTLSPCHPL